MITWPLLNNKIRKESLHNTFGMVRKHKNGTPKPHQGWDLYASVGTPLFAIGSGKVAFIQNKGDYGLQICHSFQFRGRELYAFYAHLLSVTLTKDQTVQIDQQIGFTGVSGNASNFKGDEQHLHFEIRERPILSTGLAGRWSPLRVYGRCPLKQIASGMEMIS